MTISRNWRGIENVTIEQLTTYLLEHGWQQIKYQNNRLKVFQLTNDDNFFTLPGYPSLSDFQSRMMEAIDRIAAMEDEATYVVLQRFVAEEAQ
jgi:DNA-binding Lrp family transcriptional regulator